MQYAVADLTERLRIIDRAFTNILILNPLQKLEDLLAQKYKNANISTAEDAEILDFPPASFDLIIHFLDLHWINNIPLFLAKIKYLLTADGIFLANFIGHKSLKNLRTELVKVESSLGVTHKPHIPPFIHFDQVAPTLQIAGFHEIIVDYEDISLEYKSCLALMQKIKSIGETNILIAAANYGISKKMLKILSNESEIFSDKINLITIIASSAKNSIIVKK